MGFNEETGICDHFKEPLIHALNKGKVNIKDNPYYTKIKNRNNIILLGDTIGDLQMASGINHDTCLSIGFYNAKDNSINEEYKKMYDIVVTNDGSLDVINFIIEAMTVKFD
ncbi:8093_t:CDS:1 [Scutellospora calospora]|uniref:8093_t:CDS:1 n=1 Tax=Scutellospora calospora TaxID=85575 RepID=A0ACA9NSA9_9GLOM|nr:8093_t:CDS:1 [Scutellospora calospora]